MGVRAVISPQALISVLLQPQAIEQAMVQEAAAVASNEWSRLAKAELRSTSRDYEAGLQQPVFGDRQAVIALEGWLPNAVENGISGYDMHATLLGPNAENRKPIYRYRTVQGRRVQIGVIGWYNTVPYRHMTPTASGRNGAPMGSAYAPIREGSLSGTVGKTGQPVQWPRELNQLSEKAALALGKRVHKEAKLLAATITAVNAAGKIRAVEHGGRLITATLGRSHDGTPGPIPLLRPHHKTDIYAGMARNRAAYESDVQSTYVTFRRISTMQPDGWRHPGIQARHLVVKVAAQLRTVLPAIVQRIAEETVG
jgi:hypothetical protein